MQSPVATGAISLLTFLTTAVMSPSSSATVTPPPVLKQEVASTSATITQEQQLQTQFDALAKPSSASAIPVEPTPQVQQAKQSHSQTTLLARSNSPTTLSPEQITFLGNCESGMTATRNSGNGYYGAFQFSAGTWNRMNTGYERADLAPIEVQIAAVQQLLSRSSIYGQFPACAAKMHAEGLL